MKNCTVTIKPGAWIAVVRLQYPGNRGWLTQSTKGEDFKLKSYNICILPDESFDELPTVHYQGWVGYN